MKPMMACFIAQLEMGSFSIQKPSQNGDLFFLRVLLPSLLHAFSPVAIGGTHSPFPTEPEQDALARPGRAILEIGTNLSFSTALLYRTSRTAGKPRHAALRQDLARHAGSIS